METGSNYTVRGLAQNIIFVAQPDVIATNENTARLYALNVPGPAAPPPPTPTTVNGLSGAITLATRGGTNVGNETSTILLDDSSFSQMPQIGGVPTVDLTTLSEGVHRLRLRTMFARGTGAQTVFRFVHGDQLRVYMVHYEGCFLSEEMSRVWLINAFAGNATIAQGDTEWEMGTYFVGTGEDTDGRYTRNWNRATEDRTNFRYVMEFNESAGATPPTGDVDLYITFNIKVFVR